jgi:hypothetical protein
MRPAQKQSPSCNHLPFHALDLPGRPGAKQAVADSWGSKSSFVRWHERSEHDLPQTSFTTGQIFPTWYGAWYVVGWMKSPPLKQCDRLLPRRHYSKGPLVSLSECYFDAVLLLYLIVSFYRWEVPASCALTAESYSNFPFGLRDVHVKCELWSPKPGIRRPSWRHNHHYLTPYCALAGIQCLIQASLCATTLSPCRAVGCLLPAPCNVMRDGLGGPEFSRVLLQGSATLPAVPVVDRLFLRLFLWQQSNLYRGHGW